MLTGIPAAEPDLPVPVGYGVYLWGCSPVGLLTRRQLAALGLRPGSAGHGGGDPLARALSARPAGRLPLPGRRREAEAARDPGAVGRLGARERAPGGPAPTAASKPPTACPAGPGAAWTARTPGPGSRAA